VKKKNAVLNNKHHNYGMKLNFFINQIYLNYLSNKVVLFYQNHDKNKINRIRQIIIKIIYIVEIIRYIIKK
jgi:hypothetical protein